MEKSTTIIQEEVNNILVVKENILLRSQLVETILNLDSLDERTEENLFILNSKSGLFEPGVFEQILHNLSVQINSTNISEEIYARLYEPEMLVDLELMFGDQNTTLIILDTIDIKSIELKAGYAYIPIELSEISNRLGNSVYSKLINQQFIGLFSLDVTLLSGDHKTTIIDCKHEQLQSPTWYKDHELWHVVTNLWTQASIEIHNKELLPYTPSEILTETKFEQMSQSIANKIDQYLYHEMFAFMAGGEIVNEFIFADIYLPQYEQSMYPEGVLVQPIFQRVLYDAHDSESLQKLLLKKIASYENKPKLAHEKLWLQSVYQHLMFWKLVHGMPEYLKSQGMTTRDIALLYAFDTEDAWMISHSPNPFDHLGSKLSELFEEVNKFISKN